MNIKLKILTFIFFMNFTSCLSAKEFRLISLDDFDEITGFMFVNQDGFKRLTLKKYYLNSSYSVPPVNKLTLFAINASNKEISSKPYFIIPFNEQKNDTIILLQKESDYDDKLRYDFIDNDEKNFPFHSVLVFNKTEKPIVIKVGNEIIKVRPMSSRNIKLTLKKGDFAYEKVVLAGQKINKTIDYFYSSYWKLDRNEKKICFIDFDSKSDEFRLNDMVF